MSNVPVETAVEHFGEAAAPLVLLAGGAAALARRLDDRPAHLAGIGVGGMVAQVAALDQVPRDV